MKEWEIIELQRDAIRTRMQNAQSAGNADDVIVALRELLPINAISDEMAESLFPTLGWLAAQGYSCEVVALHDKMLTSEALHNREAVFVNLLQCYFSGHGTISTRDQKLEEYRILAKHMYRYGDRILPEVRKQIENVISGFFLREISQTTDRADRLIIQYDAVRFAPTEALDRVWKDFAKDVEASYATPAERIAAFRQLGVLTQDSYRIWEPGYGSGRGFRINSYRNRDVHARCIESILHHTEQLETTDEIIASLRYVLNPDDQVGSKEQKRTAAQRLSSMVHLITDTQQRLIAYHEIIKGIGYEDDKSGIRVVNTLIRDAKQSLPEGERVAALLPVLDIVPSKGKGKLTLATAIVDDIERVQDPAVYVKAMLGAGKILSSQPKRHPKMTGEEVARRIDSRAGKIGDIQQRVDAHLVAADFATNSPSAESLAAAYVAAVRELIEGCQERVRTYKNTAENGKKGSALKRRCLVALMGEAKALHKQKDAVGFSRFPAWDSVYELDDVGGDMRAQAFDATMAAIDRIPKCAERLKELGRLFHLVAQPREKNVPSVPVFYSSCPDEQAREHAGRIFDKFISETSSFIDNYHLATTENAHAIRWMRRNGGNILSLTAKEICTYARCNSEEGLARLYIERNFGTRSRAISKTESKIDNIVRQCGELVLYTRGSPQEQAAVALYIEAIKLLPHDWRRLNHYLGSLNRLHHDRMVDRWQRTGKIDPPVGSRVGLAIVDAALEIFPRCKSSLPASSWQTLRMAALYACGSAREKQTTKMFNDNMGMGVEHFGFMAGTALSAFSEVADEAPKGSSLRRIAIRKVRELRNDGQQ